MTDLEKEREELAALLDAARIELAEQAREIERLRREAMNQLAAERQRAERAEAPVGSPFAKMIARSELAEATLAKLEKRSHIAPNDFSKPCDHGKPFNDCLPCVLDQWNYERDAIQAYCDSENEMRVERDALKGALEDIGRCGIDQEFWCAIGCPADLSAYARAALERAKGEK